jgi:hypothetical protein
MKLVAAALSLFLTLAALAEDPTAPLTSADLVKAHRNNLVFVQNAEGAGSGFIAKFGPTNFLVTNAHVAAGAKGATFKTLDGTQVPLGAPFIAAGHDIFRIVTAAGGKPLEVMERVEENASIDDDVVVLGNAEGAGVINTIKGKIVGIGPQLVEVDAPFVPGNSGSPIIHLKTGKVIGVATYLTIKEYDPATRRTMREPRVRRFGYRLDSVKTWQPVNWPLFYSQATEMERIEKLTEDLGRFLMDMAKNHTVTPGLHSNPAIKNQIEWWIAGNKRKTNPRDAALSDQNFLAAMRTASQADLIAARPRLTYDYFQRALVEQQQQRNEITNIFDKIIAELRQAR